MGRTVGRDDAATLSNGTLTAEQVEKAIHDCSTYASYDGCTYYASGIRLQAIADELNAVLEIEINGDTSDGYHTFNELYHHRAVLFSVIVRDHRELAWKAMKHHDGTMYDGMFIVGIETPKGQATYHYDLDPYWEMFDCEEREFAPEWDGHTPDEAIARIAELRSSALTADQVREAIERYVKFYEGGDYDEQAIADELNARTERTCEMDEDIGATQTLLTCSECGYTTRDYSPIFCGGCGARIRPVANLVSQKKSF